MNPRGPRPGPRLGGHPHRGHDGFRRLVEHGWVTDTGDAPTLTDEGRAEKERLDAVVGGVIEELRNEVDAEAFDTTVATLEKLAALPGAERGPRFAAFGRMGFAPPDSVDAASARTTSPRAPRVRRARSG